MFGYIDAIENNSILKDGANYKVVLNGEYVWITNYIKILSYDKSQISLKVKGNILKIEGRDITIIMMQKKEMILKGVFYSIGVDNKIDTGK